MCAFAFWIVARCLILSMQNVCFCFLDCVLLLFGSVCLIVAQFESFLSISQFGDDWRFARVDGKCIVSELLLQ